MRHGVETRLNERASTSLPELPFEISPPPRFTIEEARQWAFEFYGLRAEVRSLPGERDQNFYLRTADGEEFVLKIANRAETEEVLDLQDQAIEHLARRASLLVLQRVIPTVTGERFTVVTDSDGRPHFLRLLTYIPGRLWADVRPQGSKVLRELGRLLAQIDAALQDFSHPAADRVLRWDLRQAGWIRSALSHIASVQRRTLVARFLHDFDRWASPLLPRLRMSVIYNDANDYNVLVSGGDTDELRVIGVIDFGDLVRTYTVSEVAIACAYACMDKPDPITAASEIVAGYHNVFPLTEGEVEALYWLIGLRLCLSLTNAALQRRLQPDNPYLLISEKPAWEFLEKLVEVHPSFAQYAFRQACGWSACPASPHVVTWLRDHVERVGPLTEPSFAADDVVSVDLGVGSQDVPTPDDLFDATEFERQLMQRMAAQRARAAVAGHNVARPLAPRHEFRVETNDGPQWRTVHLGLDLFVEAGTSVLAPLDGIVHSFSAGVSPLGHGPTVILEHRAGDDGPVFFTLYGRLSARSLEGMHEGQQVQRGQRLGWVGSREENGGQPPHVHFQIICDLLGHRGDFPGLVVPSERSLWTNLCPDPAMIFPWAAKAVGQPMTAQQVLHERRRYFSPSVRLAYRQPLLIVRGWRQYLYDEHGRAYLDCVNNVAHVGHSHPRVVRAIGEQTAVLTTNTRYLHENLVRYAERLCATLPEPLRVCFFVNSGSEANELALRLARAHTRGRDIIVIDQAYHGHTTSLIDISPYKFNGPGGGGAPAHVHVVATPDTYRGPHRRDDPRAGIAYAQEVGEVIERIQARGGKLMAFIGESLMGCAGQIVLPDGYLAEVYRLVRGVGGVCIADEVQVGFGRVGSHFWGFQTQGVVPDIVTMGKPIGNGYPLGAVVTTPEIAASFETGMEYFNTFGGNPVACAAGLAVLDVLEEEQLMSNALMVGNHLLLRLGELMARHPIIGDVRGKGLFIGVELVRNRTTLEPASAEAAYIVNRMKELGVLLSTDGPFANVVKIKPPLVFRHEDAEFLTAMLDRVLGEDRARVE
jgi:4-aminobutyrate aminotransferase-like enzyme/Ser/Thr protein kinase RdoA (MazF antagonist)